MQLAKQVIVVREQLAARQGHRIAWNGPARADAIIGARPRW